MAKGENESDEFIYFFVIYRPYNDDSGEYSEKPEEAIVPARNKEEAERKFKKSFRPLFVPRPKVLHVFTLEEYKEYLQTQEYLQTRVKS